MHSYRFQTNEENLNEKNKKTCNHHFYGHPFSEEYRKIRRIA